jgi:hypothetical protein
MPRKSTKKVEATTEETKEKKTTKKEATKKEEPKVEFNIAEVVNWTDEECTAKDKDLKFHVADVRNILRSLVSVNEKLVETTKNFNILRVTLAKGLMTGYQVTCPHCHREYVVDSMSLNRTYKVMCKICGTEYKEDENITGIKMSSDDDKVEVI